MMRTLILIAALALTACAKPTGPVGVIYPRDAYGQPVGLPANR